MQQVDCEIWYFSSLSEC